MSTANAEEVVNGMRLEIFVRHRLGQMAEVAQIGNPNQRRPLLVGMHAGSAVVKVSIKQKEPKRAPV